MRGNQLMAEKRARDAHEAAQKKALAELAATGDTDLAAISEAHHGADVVVEDDGTVVVRYA